LLTIGCAMIPVTMLIVAAVIKHKSGSAEEELATGTTAAKKESSSRITARVDTWIGRVENFMYGSTDAADDDHYQVNQAKIAIARGGFLGEGPGNGEAPNFLPQAYNDYIYATLIEEYGLLGGAFIIFIYLVFLYRSIRLFKKCPFAFGAFLALGLSFTLVIQAMANMAVNVNLFPVTGVTLPLVSMGGSSFLFTCLSIGIILSVARNVEQLEGKKAQEAAEANREYDEIDNEEEEEEMEDEVEEDAGNIKQKPAIA
ncbi:MAG: FtsW/RodA/SpoVE family cell cycle protein, partial [Bacteroidota bacterium]|nr:FtsW/RodA/SpoVE family cell cycle protein [Bacteroidota bacterium]